VEGRSKLPKRKATANAAANSDDEQQASVRPFWSGTISFGLVSIPVDLYPANRANRISLRTLGPNGEPLSRQYYSPETGRNLQSDATTRGYEVAEGKYVTVTDEELERLAPEKTRDIALRLFVTREEIPPIYFDRAYFLAPSDKSAKAYRLLAQTMEERERVGVATFVMREREYLVAIYAENGILTAEAMRFHDEVRTPADVGLPKKKKAPPKAMVKKFETAMTRTSKRSLDLKEMRDEYAQAFMKMVEKKRAADKDVVETEAEPGRKKPAKVVDLMEVLKKSLKAA
jgi:DNA end-binding protein Ku